MKSVSRICCLAALLLTAACREEPGESTLRDPERANAQAPQTRDPVEGTALESAPSALKLRVQPGPPPYLGDETGAALYYLEDNQDGSRCTGACEDAWPPVVVGDARPEAGSGVDAGRIGTIARPGGSQHLTYDNKPLYRYAGDRGSGRTSGQDVKDKWGQWRLIGPDGGPVRELVSPDGQRR